VTPINFGVHPKVSPKQVVFKFGTQIRVTGVVVSADLRLEKHVTNVSVIPASSTTLYSIETPTSTLRNMTVNFEA